MKKLLILFWIILGVFSYSFKEGKTRLKVKINDIKEVQGNLGLLVFNQADGFPDDVSKAFLEKEVKVTGKQMIIDLNELPIGNYAIAVVHDVNANKNFDRNLIGIPKEPFGFSRNKSIFKGLPKFEEASLSLSSAENEITIDLIELW
jgi:uncharacterized protein (DUF2141 family)